MNKDIEKIVNALKESNRKHLCFVLDKDYIAVSQYGDAQDLYRFLLALVVNVPWAREVIEGFLDDIDDMDFDEEEEDDTPQYLN